MRSRSRPGRAATAAVAMVATLAGCVYIKDTVRVADLPAKTGTRVASPVKAHLVDGSTVVYAHGVTVGADAIEGRGARFDAALTPQPPVDRVPLAEVVGMESYATVTNSGETAVISLLATAGGVVGGALLSVAIFGSCPTVYAPGDGPEAVQAELFSTSIAPLLESRDVDPLRISADASGRVTLDIRNEALETHYINHLQLLEVRHPRGTRSLPDTRGRAVAVTVEAAAPWQARDRRGRDVAALVAHADGSAFATAAEVLAAAGPADFADWVDLDFARAPAGAGAEALVLRMRNSLLGTILFYEVMLADAGPKALEWLGPRLDEISTAVELGRWHQDRMGLRVEAWDGRRFRHVARVRDSGPIAWREVAVPLPPWVARPVRTRLSFTADLWRLDRVALVRMAPDAAVRSLPAARVVGSDDRADTAALAGLAAPDTRYLQTGPGQRFAVEFEAGPVAPGIDRTFLLSSQGYYQEWIRAEWLRRPPAPGALQPSDAALQAALTRWRDTKATYEARFDRDRVPVR
jgi:hypothetical protein